MQQVSNLLANLNYTPKVWAKVYGQMVKLNEVQVRALQVIALHKAHESKESFEEFANNVVIYCNTKSGGRGGEMRILENGRFEESFDYGFYDVCAQMTIELIRAERGKPLALKTAR